MNRTAIFLTTILVLSFLWAGSLLANPTTAYEATLVVAGQLNANPYPLGIRLGPQIDHVETFADDTGEPIYYITYLKPSGFVIVSADDLVEPIIGFSPLGIFNPSPSNPLGALVSHDLRGRMITARTPPVSPFRATSGLRVATAPDHENHTQIKWRDLMSSAAPPRGGIQIMGLATAAIDDPRVDPLLGIEGIQWGQGALLCGDACYNYFTPRVQDGIIEWEPGRADNYLCGCDATAMAQLMRFHREPSEPIVLRPITIDVMVNSTPKSIERWLLGGTGPAGAMIGT